MKASRILQLGLLVLIAGNAYRHRDAIALRLGLCDSLSQAWGMRLDRRMNELPDHGKIESSHIAWAYHYWPHAKGGITYRWQNEKGETQPFRYPTYSRAELLKLKADARGDLVKSLSPAEKFDLLRGRYDYPLVRAERERTYRAMASAGTDAAGGSLNYGWIVGATHYAEPNAVTRTNSDGIEIPFAASDIKALMSYYYGVKAFQKVPKFVVNHIDPASFHIVLANMIGKNRLSFAANLDPTPLIDNRPIVGFESDIRFESEGWYRVRTTVEFSRIRAPQWQAFEFYNLDTDSATFEYRLEVDSNEQIVRGQWISAKHPEGAWRSETTPLDPEWSDLKELYQPVNDWS